MAFYNFRSFTNDVITNDSFVFRNGGQVKRFDNFN